jgi:hypothetical protein
MNKTPAREIEVGSAKEAKDTFEQSSLLLFHLLSIPPPPYIYNNITYLYCQYNINVTVIFCHTFFVYHSDVCRFVYMFYTIFYFRGTYVLFSIFNPHVFLYHIKLYINSLK